MPTSNVKEFPENTTAFSGNTFDLAPLGENNAEN